MTNREFYKAVIEAKISDELTAHAEKEIGKLDARNEKRSTTMNKTQKENVEILKMSYMSSVVHGVLLI